jgi:NTP pyrophosphatase (non-canonical NTP hydrolase)
MSKSLTFKQLRKANVARCEKHFHSIESWSETDWATALAGEVGELCNYIKKRRRAKDSIYNRNVKKKNNNDYLKDCAKEVADIQCYLDLISAKLGLELDKCTRMKFNEVSKRVGSKIRL